MIETSNSVKNIDAKIFAIQAAAPIIRKEADNPYFKSKYAEYPEIQAAIKPLIQKEALLVMFLPVSDNKLTMYVKDTTSNEFYKCTSDLNMTAVSPQAQGSAITYLKRYMLTAFFDLQIEDAMDDDGNAGSQKQQPKQQNQPAQQQQAPAKERPYINTDTEKWFQSKLFIFNEGGTLERLLKKYRISKENGEKLAKQEDLKPGSKMWEFATLYLSKEGAVFEPIAKAFNITDQDAQDLQIDATNLQTTNTTK